MKLLKLSYSNFFATVLAAVSCSDAWMQTNAKISFTEKHLAVLQRVELAASSKSEDALTTARVTIEALPPRTGEKKVNRHDRDVKLNLLLAALQKADAARDKKFDTSKPPSIKISPPRGKDGRLYEAGISPDSINDGSVREEYIRLLAANTEKIKKYNVELGLKMVRDDYARSIQAFRSWRKGSGFRLFS